MQNRDAVAEIWFAYFSTRGINIYRVRLSKFMHCHGCKKKHFDNAVIGGIRALPWKPIPSAQQGVPWRVITPIMKKSDCWMSELTIQNIGLDSIFYQLHHTRKTDLQSRSDMTIYISPAPAHKKKKDRPIICSDVTFIKFSYKSHRIIQ